MTNFSEIIKDCSIKYHIPETLICAIIETESSFKPNAVSPAGAMGLMQLMPATANILKCKDAFDPLQNINAGCLHFKNLLYRFHNIPLGLERYKFTLGAYNLGSTRITAAMNKAKQHNKQDAKWSIVSTFLRDQKHINWQETVLYVDKVMETFHINNMKNTVTKLEESQKKEIIMYSPKKTLNKGFKFSLTFLIPFILTKFIASSPELSTMTFSEIITKIIDSTAIGTLTIGSSVTMLINWLKHKNKT